MRNHVVPCGVMEALHLAWAEIAADPNARVKVQPGKGRATVAISQKHRFASVTVMGGAR